MRDEESPAILIPHPSSLIPSPQDVGTRLDVYLARALPDLTRAEAQRMIAAGRVMVNGRAETKASYKLRAGDTLAAKRLPPPTTDLTPEDIPLAIVYEDDDVLVINKARGMAAHPAPGALHGTLVHAVLFHLGAEWAQTFAPDAEDDEEAGGLPRPGIAHRLDKDTTGLIVVAKNESALRALQQQIQSRTAERRYVALVWGRPRFRHAIVEAPIGRHPADRTKMAVLPSALAPPHPPNSGGRRRAREAHTELTVIETIGPFALLDCKLHTGRTHQIRVHCQFAGHPVVGDTVYGGLRRVPVEGLAASDRKRVEEGVAALGGQALHARTLAFDHPRTHERREFSAPLPDDFAALLDTLRGVYA